MKNQSNLYPLNLILCYLFQVMVVLCQNTIHVLVFLMHSKSNLKRIGKNDTFLIECVKVKVVQFFELHPEVFLLTVWL